MKYIRFIDSIMGASVVAFLSVGSLISGTSVAVAVATVAAVTFSPLVTERYSPPVSPVDYARPIAETATVEPVPVSIRIPFSRTYRARSHPV